MRAQAIDELINRSGRVADGPDCRSSRHRTVWQSERGIATGREERRSIRWQFFGIDFEQSQPAVGDVLSFIETIAHLYGSDKEIATSDKGKVSLRRGLECATDNGSIVDSRDRRHDIQLMVDAIEELNDDPRMGSGSSILQDVKE